jgi:hypothetical protein
MTSKIVEIATAVVIAAYLSGHLREFNRWVYLQTAQVLWESRSSAWGSPKFFKKAGP